MSTNAPQITTKRAVKILGYSDRSSIIALIDAKALTPASKFPTKTGGYTFYLADIIALAEKRQAERLTTHADLDIHLEAARAAAEASIADSDMEDFLDAKVVELTDAREEMAS